MKHNFEDLMGLTIETGDAFLDKKLNSHLCYKGGSPATSGLDPDVKRFLLPQLESAASRRDDFSRVEGFSDEQRESLDSARGVASRQDRLAGQSRAGVDTLSSIARGDPAFEQSIINQANLAEGDRRSARGPRAVGSAREDRARAFGRARLGDSLTQARAGAASQLGAATAAQQQAEGAGAGTLFKAGEARQQQGQKESDSIYQGYQRLFGLFGGLPLQSSTGASGGK